MENVLIITYYWPPSGGSGVQRWLKFSKYLPEFGYRPHVYTPENPDFNVQDESLLKDISKETIVYKRKILEPYSIQRLFFKGANNTVFGVTNNKANWKSKLSLWLRSNVFVPDPKFLWVRPSIKDLKVYIEKHNIKKVITTGPPHSMHLIGLGLKKAFGSDIHWIADFRDPWVEIDFFHHMPMMKLIKKRHQQLETSVLKSADRTIVIGNHMKTQFEDRAKQIDVITNGFDDFGVKEEIETTTSFSLTHIGVLNRDRNSQLLWDVLVELCKEDEDFKKHLEVRFIGQIAPETISFFQTYLKSNFIHIPKVPHEEVRNYQVSSQVLLLLVNKVPNSEGIITGKIFEYLNAKRPIMAIGPKGGDLAEIINQTESGQTIDFDDRVGMKQYIWSCFEHYLQKDLNVHSKNIEQYHRKSLTKNLADMLDTL